MIRHNGVQPRVRTAAVPGPEVGGRTRCLSCGVMLPRGVDRPFCVDDSPYARRLQPLIQQEARRPATADAAA